jgi:hypothetical protein
VDDLISEAAALDDDGGDDDEMLDESEDGGKADFVRMCKAIEAGDYDAAWEAYQACRDGGAAPPPIDDM